MFSDELRVIESVITVKAYNVADLDTKVIELAQSLKYGKATNLPEAITLLMKYASWPYETSQALPAWHVENIMRARSFLSDLLSLGELVATYGNRRIVFDSPSYQVAEMLLDDNGGARSG